MTEVCGCALELWKKKSKEKKNERKKKKKNEAESQKITNSAAIRDSRGLEIQRLGV